MKIVKKILLGLFLLLFFVCCKEEEVRTPLAEITVNKTMFGINETMVINFTGVADQVVIFPGDDMQNYDFRKESNTGLVVNKNLFTYAYLVPGVYKVVCVASVYNDLAVDLKHDTCSFIVNVVDDQTEIDQISCPQIIYDEVFAQKLENDNWLMVLPRRIRYNNANPAISLEQRLRFYIQSDSTKVFVNGNEFSSTVRYDLSSTTDILVRSHFGTERPYKLFTINIPEFNTFRLLGATGTLVRNEFNYSTFFMDVTLPTGTDITNITPEFETFLPTEKVYIGNIEQISGTTSVDFSQTVTYRLISMLNNNPEMQTESFVTVRISFQ